MDAKSFLSMLKMSELHKRNFLCYQGTLLAHGGLLAGVFACLKTLVVVESGVIGKLQLHSLLVYKRNTKGKMLQKSN